MYKWGTYGSKTKRAVSNVVFCVHSLEDPLLGAGTRNKQVKSTEVGQEGGTNQAKMIKIDAANGCSPPVSNLNTTRNTGMRIRVWRPVQVVPDVTGTNQSAEFTQ
jgi:hypothetical protein